MMNECEAEGTQFHDKEILLTFRQTLIKEYRLSVIFFLNFVLSL